jgi:hypothetical protein
MVLVKIAPVQGYGLNAPLSRQNGGHLVAGQGLCDEVSSANRERCRAGYNDAGKHSAGHVA